MCAGIDLLEKVLCQDIFLKYVEVLLTDRGSEFSAADAMETGKDGSRHTRVFYCDLMRSGQKGTLENKHNELRYILPKECDLRALGLTDQNALNLAVSHVNSKSEESLEGKSALDLTRFLYKDLFKRLKAFGIELIDKDEVTVKPYLLKNSCTSVLPLRTSICPQASKTTITTDQNIRTQTSPVPLPLIRNEP